MFPVRTFSGLSPRLSQTIPLLTVLVAVLGPLGGCTIDNGDVESRLDKLRILGLRSDPPDLVLGEQAQLSALVHDPDAGQLTYEWSWCPRRGTGDEGFECLTDEASLQAAWNELDTGSILPGYDLGNSATAAFDLAFDVELAVPLCEALTRDEADAETALFLCLSELELSFRLEVRSDDELDTAIRTVPIVAAGAERNQNPDPSGELLVNGVAFVPGGPIQQGFVEVTVDFGPEQSQMFTPPPEPDSTESPPRLETLFLSWYSSTGTLESEMLDGGFGDVETSDALRTSFVDGGDFDALRRASWGLEEVGATAQLYLVLRDERGGLAFIEHDLGTIEASP